MAFTRDETSLRWWHMGAAVAHGVQSVASGVVLAMQDVKDRGSLPLLSQSFDRTTWSVSSDYIRWLVPIFPALSTMNHVVSYGQGQAYFQELYTKGTNTSRWVEYGASAGLMTWMISALSGNSSVHSLSRLVLLNVFLQFSGYVLERAGINATEQDPLVMDHLMIMGWGIFLAIWAPIISQFQLTLVDTEDIPALVSLIVYLELVLFASFGIVAWRWKRFVSRQRTAASTRSGIITREKWYIGLSIVSKSLLTWMAVGGAINVRA